MTEVNESDIAIVGMAIRVPGASNPEEFWANLKAGVEATKPYTDDQWADPPGQFDTLKAAAPVYKLLGVDGLGAAKCPAEGALLDSRLGYWVRPGKHSMTPADWATYLTFADKWLK